MSLQDIRRVDNADGSFDIDPYMAMEKRFIEVMKGAFLCECYSGGPTSKGLFWLPGRGVGLANLAQTRLADFGQSGNGVTGLSDIRSRVQRAANANAMTGTNVSCYLINGTLQISVTCDQFNAKLSPQGQ